MAFGLSSFSEKPTSIINSNPLGEPHLKTPFVDSNDDDPLASGAGRLLESLTEASAGLFPRALAEGPTFAIAETS
jgi:hypothetical protein